MLPLSNYRKTYPSHRPVLNELRLYLHFYDFFGQIEYLPQDAEDGQIRIESTPCIHKELLKKSPLTVPPNCSAWPKS